MGSLTEAPKDLLLLNNENSTKAFSLHSTDIWNLRNIDVKMIIILYMKSPKKDFASIN